jgi:hypothetical protein
MAEAPPHRARVVDEDVDLPMAVEHRADEARGGVGSRSAEVLRDGQDLDIRPPESGRCGVEFVLLSRTDRRLAAHLAERLGHLESDATRSARHQRNLSAEIKQLARLHSRPF